MRASRRPARPDARGASPTTAYPITTAELATAPARNPRRESANPATSRKYSFSLVFGTGWKHALSHFSSQVTALRLPVVCPSIGRNRLRVACPPAVCAVSCSPWSPCDLGESWPVCQRPDARPTDDEEQDDERRVNRSLGAVTSRASARPASRPRAGDPDEISAAAGWSLRPNRSRGGPVCVTRARAPFIPRSSLELPSERAAKR